MAGGPEDGQPPGLTPARAPAQRPGRPSLEERLAAIQARVSAGGTVPAYRPEADTTEVQEDDDEALRLLHTHLGAVVVEHWVRVGPGRLRDRMSGQERDG